MKSGLTELIFILDRSGSMGGLEEETIGGFNSMLKKQSDETEAGEVIVTTVLFDDLYELLHDRINIKGIRPITKKEYFVRGSTALLDAVGKTIGKIVNAHRNTIEDERPEKVMFVITTDGMENASKEYRYDKIKEMIEHQKDRYGWEFIFLGANIDAFDVAERMGIARDKAANFHADKQGMKTSLDSVNEAVSYMRQNREVSQSWKKDVDDDYKERKPAR